MLLAYHCCGQTSIHFNYITKVDTALSFPKKLDVRNGNVNQVIDSVVALTKRQGYINSLKKKLQKQSDSLYLQTIDLGRRVKVLQINYSDQYWTYLENSLSRKHTLYIPIEKVDSVLTDINKFIADQGYSFNTVKLKDFVPKSNDTLIAELNIELGKRRTIDRVVIKGYEKFPIQTLRSSYRNKESLGPKIIEDISSNISKINFAEEARPAEVLFKQDSTILYLYLEKKAVNSAEGLLGFNNTVDNKLELNGFLDLVLINNLNQAETLAINYRNENEDQTTLDVALGVPYLFKSNFGIAGNLNIKRRDSTYQNTSYDLGVTYKPNWQIDLGLSYRRQESTSLDNNSIPVEDFTSNGIVLSAVYQKIRSRDRLMPFDFSGHLQASFDNRSLINSEIQRQVITLDVEKLWELDMNNFIYTRINGAYINREDLQFSELFQLGGIGSIRGFNQNGIDAAAFAVLSTEYRYRFTQNLYAFSILDGGIVRPFMQEETENLLGLGAGIGILTQAGILNISIANGRFENANFDLSSTIAHLMLRVSF